MIQLQPLCDISNEQLVRDSMRVIVRVDPFDTRDEKVSVAVARRCSPDPAADVTLWSANFRPETLLKTRHCSLTS